MVASPHSVGPAPRCSVASELCGPAPSLSWEPCLVKGPAPLPQATDGGQQTHPQRVYIALHRDDVLPPWSQDTGGLVPPWGLGEAGPQGGALRPVLGGRQPRSRGYSSENSFHVVQPQTCNPEPQTRPSLPGLEPQTVPCPVPWASRALSHRNQGWPVVTGSSLQTGTDMGLGPSGQKESPCSLVRLLMLVPMVTGRCQAGAGGGARPSPAREGPARRTGRAVKRGNFSSFKKKISKLSP